MALLYLQQKVKHSGAASPCANGVERGENALAVDCAFWGGLLSNSEQGGAAELKYAAQICTVVD